MTTVCYEVDHDSREEKRYHTNQKYPVILSAKSHVTKLIVTKYHVRYKHPVGTDLMLAQLQKRFIILGLAWEI